ncbi:MAG: type IV toxin-antitoxin system AbiEi family antitoxin [Acidobacteria bacterium]|nr:type IV toxin-antitoxin system AbiEi family antitoxin [Acidobacteriota bacterium]
MNKVIQYTRQQAFVEPLPTRGFRVRDYEGLLKFWRKAYRFDRFARRRYFTLLPHQVITDRLHSLGINAPGEIAYSAFSAADWQAPHVRQSKNWLYVSAGMEVKFRETIEAKEVDSGENVVVVIARDSGVFYGLDLSEKRLACTNPVQTYIDLINAGGRGEEAAEAMLQQRLMPAWTGTVHEL